MISQLIILNFSQEQYFDAHSDGKFHRRVEIGDLLRAEFKYVEQFEYLST